MFNFFEEIKKELKLPMFDFGYNMVNISGKALYVEGHKGIMKIASDSIIFKVKNKVITVCGQNLSLKVLSENTLSVIGEIKSVEAI